MLKHNLYLFLIGAINKLKIQANQEIKRTAKIQANFYAPLVLPKNKIEIKGKSQIKPMNNMTISAGGEEFSIF